MKYGLHRGKRKGLSRHDNETLVFVLLTAGTSWAATSGSRGDDIRIWSAPLVARPGEKLELIAVSTSGDLSELRVTDSAGRRTRMTTVKGGGPPWSLRAALPAPARGSYLIEATREGKVVASAVIQVGKGAGSRRREKRVDFAS